MKWVVGLLDVNLLDGNKVYGCVFVVWISDFFPVTTSVISRDYDCKPPKIWMFRVKRKNIHLALVCKFTHNQSDFTYKTYFPGGIPISFVIKSNPPLPVATVQGWARWGGCGQLGVEGGCAAASVSSLELAARLHCGDQTLGLTRLSQEAHGLLGYPWREEEMFVMKRDVGTGDNLRPI